jgi:hypothetical protein
MIKHRPTDKGESRRPKRIGHYRLKPRPLAVDAFRLCRSGVFPACKSN